MSMEKSTSFKWRKMRSLKRKSINLKLKSKPESLENDSSREGPERAIKEAINYSARDAT